MITAKKRAKIYRFAAIVKIRGGVPMLHKDLKQYKDRRNEFPESELFEHEKWEIPGGLFNPQYHDTMAICYLFAELIAKES